MAISASSIPDTSQPSSSSSSPCPWVPPQPQLDEESKTHSSVEIVAPDDVPDNVNLMLQLKRDSDTRFFDYASHVASGERIFVTSLEACTWYLVRWVALPMR